MAFLTLDQLPFVGMSYEFHGEKQRAPFSAYIVEAKPAVTHASVRQSRFYD
jgi:hypothetical protein